MTGIQDWKIFHGDGRAPHDGLAELPKPPPWRMPERYEGITPAGDVPPSEEVRARAFIPTPEMVVAVNAALYLRRPLLLTGKPGGGKSTLISKVAHELMLGPVLRWHVSSRSTVRSGVYDYDAVGRLQAGRDREPPVEDYLSLGPLGTALIARGRPRALLIDEIDKSDLDFANDLLNVIEEGEYDIPELRRLQRPTAIRDAWGGAIEITDGRVLATQFPFVVMTSNAEREFPAPFLRRCIRLTVRSPDRNELANIVHAQLDRYRDVMDRSELDALVNRFHASQTKDDLATDQLLNAVFLTVAMRGGEGRSFSPEELSNVQDALLRTLTGPGA